MDETTRKAIEKKFAEMTEGDWKKLREEIRKDIENDPALQAWLLSLDTSDISPPKYESGNQLRFRNP